MKKFIRRLVSVSLLALVAVGCATLLILSCRTRPPLPAGVNLKTSRVTLTGKSVAVDIYTPAGVAAAPVVVVAHGFSRDRITMAGWGGLLATNGFVVLVLDQPGWKDYQRNAKAIVELLAAARAGELFQQPHATARAAVVGFSLGGLATLLATAEATNICCWVGLDPVDQHGDGRRAAANIRVPGVVLRAEPLLMNWKGNARGLAKRLPGAVFTARVCNANHCDPENPTDWLGELVCGRTDPARRRVFEEYAVAGLRATLLGDARALEFLRSASSDRRVGDVELRHGQDFLPHAIPTERQ